MNSIQEKLYGWVYGLLPHRLVKKEEAHNYEKLLLAVHDAIVESNGDPKGQREGCSLLLGAMNIICQFKTKQDVFFCAAFVYKELATRHYFIEGNKRTAHCMAKAHLFSEGFHLKVHYRYAEPFIKEIAEGQKKLPEIIDWLEKNSAKYQGKSREKYLKPSNVEKLRELRNLFEWYEDDFLVLVKKLCC